MTLTETPPRILDTAGLCEDYAHLFTDESRNAGALQDFFPPGWDIGHIGAICEVLAQADGYIADLGDARDRDYERTGLWAADAYADTALIQAEAIAGGELEPLPDDNPDGPDEDDGPGAA